MASRDLGCVPGRLIDWAAGVIGIHAGIVRAQINAESGGRCDAVSSAGAQGPAQFMPGTWSGLGCGGNPHNANDAMKCYAKYMYQLIRQEHGNVRDALAAYNAGPGNLSAGYGYADSILAAAGESAGVKASGGTGDAGSGGQGSPADAACALSLGGQHVGILFGHGPTLPSACLIRKTEVRALIGAMLLGVGGLIMLPGLALVAAAGFRNTRTGQQILSVASMAPGPAGGVARAAGGRRGAARPASRYRVTEREPLGGQMGGTRTVQYSSRRRPRRDEPED